MTRHQPATYHAHFKGAPRQSLAFHLAMQELAVLIARRGAVSSGERSEAAAADTAQASTLPDGNHGENISGVPNHD